MKNIITHTMKLISNDRGRLHSCVLKFLVAFLTSCSLVFEIKRYGASCSSGVVVLVLSVYGVALSKPRKIVEV